MKTYTNCTHEKVCRIVPEIRAGFRHIIEPHFGGKNPAWFEVYELVAKLCKHYDEWVTP